MEKYYDLKCLLKNTKDEKLKIFIYRNSYNELGLSTLCVEKDKEIERLKDDNKYLNKVNINLSSEKNILNSIIKEVREKIESVQMLGLRSGKTLIATLLNDILEILDKEKK